MKNKNKINRLNHLQAYTLLELLVVLSIVSILGTLSISEYSAYITRSRWSSNFEALRPLKLAIAQCLQINNNDTDLCNDFQKIDMLQIADNNTYNIITPTGPMYLPNGTATLNSQASIVVTGDAWEGGNRWRLGRPACVVTIKPLLSVNTALQFQVSYQKNSKKNMRCSERYLGKQVI